MNNNSHNHFRLLLFVLVLLMLPAPYLATAQAQSAPNISVNGSVMGGNARRGRAAQAVVVMDIPSGFHVNSNQPLEKFLIATQLQIEAPEGVKVSPVIYPRPALRKLKFSKNNVSVYEGRTTIRFNVTIPGSFGSDSVELKARLRYQSCNDEVCFPPQNRELTIPVKVSR